MKRKSLLPPVLVLIYAALTAMNWLAFVYLPGFYARVFRGEDHLIEWITFTGFSLASLITFLTVKAFWKDMDRWSRLYLAGLAFFCFLCAGEEISWGQRLFGFKTPESMKPGNEQGEFNLHNEKMKHFHPVAVVSGLIKVYGILLPLACAIGLRNKAPFWRRYVPALMLVPCFLYAELLITVTRVVRHEIEPRIGPDKDLIIKLDTVEMKEMYWGLSMMLAAISIHGAWRKTSREAPP